MTKETEMKLLKLFYEIRYCEVTPDAALDSMQEIFDSEIKGYMELRGKVSKFNQSREQLELAAKGLVL